MAAAPRAAVVALPAVRTATIYIVVYATLAEQITLAAIALAAATLMVLTVAAVPARRRRWQVDDSAQAAEDRAADIERDAEVGL